MTEHDRIRRDRALARDPNDLGSLADAIRGLQSTDDPSLVPLHDKIMEEWSNLLRAQHKDPKHG